MYVLVGFTFGVSILHSTIGLTVPIVIGAAIGSIVFGLFFK